VREDVGLPVVPIDTLASYLSGGGSTDRLDRLMHIKKYRAKDYSDFLDAAEDAM
jgi:hypothetical protein